MLAAVLRQCGKRFKGVCHTATLRLDEHDVVRMNWRRLPRDILWLAPLKNFWPPHWPPWLPTAGAATAYNYVIRTQNKKYI